jgi:integrase/recombinase XerD
MLLEELIDLFIQSRKLGLRDGGAKVVARPRTIENYQANAEYFVKFMQEQRSKTNYEGIKRADVMAFIQNIQGRVWSDATKLGVFRVARMLFRFVEKDEECRQDKLTNWEKLLPPFKKAPRKEFIPSPKDLKEVLKSWNTNTVYGLRNYAAYSLMLGCGLRIGEVCYLRMNHLFLNDGYLNVPMEGKTGSRLVHLDTKVVSVLTAWLKRRATIIGADKTDLVFVARGGRQCNRLTFGTAFRKIQPGRGKTNRITPHTLRHAFGTYYLDNGGDLARLQTIMGHKSLETTSVYLHLANIKSDKGKEELERVSPLKMLTERSK